MDERSYTFFVEYDDAALLPILTFYHDVFLSSDHSFTLSSSQVPNSPSAHIANHSIYPVTLLLKTVISFTKPTKYNAANNAHFPHLHTPTGTVSPRPSTTSSIRPTEIPSPRPPETRRRGSVLSNPCSCVGDSLDDFEELSKSGNTRPKHAVTLRSAKPNELLSRYWWMIFWRTSNSRPTSPQSIFTIYIGGHSRATRHGDRVASCRALSRHYELLGLWHPQVCQAWS